ncbi:MAG: hypothetical protein ACP5I3_00095 [Thermoproteus sp.]|jgi:hypothetical protein
MPWLALLIHYLYVIGRIDRIWYLALAASSLAVAMAPRFLQSRWDDIGAFGYLYRRRRFCAASVPLAVTAYATLLAVGALSLYLYFFWPPSTVLRLVDVSKGTALWIVVYNATIHNKTMLFQIQILDRYFQSPLSWPFYALAIIGGLHTAVSASLLAYWRSIGSVNDAVARSMELYERGRRLLT